MMKRFCFALMLVACAGAARATDAVAPTFTATALDGRAVDLAALRRAKPVYLYFFAQWCETYLLHTDPAAAARCAEGTSSMQQLAVRFGDRIAFVGIASSLSAEPAGVRAFLKKHDVRYPVVFDDGGRIFARYGVTAFPTSVLMGRDGRSVDRAVGTLAPARLQALLSKAARPMR